MEASVLDLRRRMKSVLRALERNESVTLLYRGRKKAVIRSAASERGKGASVVDHPAFGMWKGRKDLADVAKAVRVLRKGRFDAL